MNSKKDNLWKISACYLQVEQKIVASSENLALATWMIIIGYWIPLVTQLNTYSVKAQSEKNGIHMLR